MNAKQYDIYALDDTTLESFERAVANAGWVGWLVLPYPQYGVTEAYAYNSDGTYEIGGLFREDGALISAHLTRERDGNFTKMALFRSDRLERVGRALNMPKIAGWLQDYL